MEQGKDVALARVVDTWGSAPRRPGAWMGISSDGDIAGSVSGGCVEGAVREKALSVLTKGAPQILEFGIDNESAWAVGLSCGGRLKVVVQPFPSTVGDNLLDAVERGEPVVWTTTWANGELIDTLDEHPDPSISAMRMTGQDAGWTIEQHIGRHPRLIIVGGADIAVHLVRMADHAGFETILIDPRAVFTDADRFPVAPTHIHTSWPQEVLPDLRLDEATFAVLLTHDPKIDDPAITRFLTSNIAYIGALGGRKTQQKRRKRLLDSGHSRKDVDRIHGPVGLDIGAATPAEIAVSILAEVIKVHRGG